MSNGVHLLHWTEKQTLNENQLQQNKFSKYNKPLEMLEYTMEEYNQILQDVDWKKEETDYLFSLCKEFDLRWAVIYDRYTFGKPRSLVELRDRYNQVCRKLISSRVSMNSNDPHSKMELQKYTYDKYKDIQRRRNLEILYSRTAQQIYHEQVLYSELKKRQVYEQEWNSESKELVHMLKNYESQVPIPLAPFEKRKQKKDQDSIKKKRTSMDVDVSGDGIYTDKM